MEEHSQISQIRPNFVHSSHESYEWHTRKIWSLSGKSTVINTHITAIDGPDELPISPSILRGGPEFARTAGILPCPRYNNGISAIEVCLDTDDQTAARNRLALFMHEMFFTQGSRRFA
ncbi:hypothetical protein M422DRAFT_243124 [Sphaerobolus stellatus SS14]|nr:hypothetical protein M422DRAFT_243124 [Sphaerobolus stellatus SS14]